MSRGAFKRGSWQRLECTFACVTCCCRMGYVYLWLAGILPRGSKNNVLQWLVQFLLGFPVPIHMASFCWGRRCHRKNIRVARCGTWPPGGDCLKSQTSLSENRESASGPCKGVRSISVSRGLLRQSVGCICLSRDVGPVCYFTDSESAAALAASHAAPAL